MTIHNMAKTMYYPMKSQNYHAYAYLRTQTGAGATLPDTPARPREFKDYHACDAADFFLAAPAFL